MSVCLGVLVSVGFGLMICCWGNGGFVVFVSIKFVVNYRKSTTMTLILLTIEEYRIADNYLPFKDKRV